VRLMFVCCSVAVTVAPGTAAPLESVTFPSSVPVTACALAVVGDVSRMPRTVAQARARGPYNFRDAFHERIKFLLL
jgi:hypothetical protein